jgi:Arc/MetJ-type ribon-helix-helix transcriptional regulator
MRNLWKYRQYSPAYARGGENEAILCLEHRRLSNILGQKNSPTPAQSVDTDTQRTRKITIRVPQSLVEAADANAESQGQTRSELVRDALQMYVELDEVNESLSDLMSQAISGETDSNKNRSSEGDVEFLKARIRKLESLLEDSLEKI